jgi:hypothetical protein
MEIPIDARCWRPAMAVVVRRAAHNFMKRLGHTGHVKSAVEPLQLTRSSRHRRSVRGSYARYSPPFTDRLLRRITGGRYEAAELPLQKPGESNCHAILKIWSDDLHPDRETGR